MDVFGLDLGLGPHYFIWDRVGGIGEGFRGERAGQGLGFVQPCEYYSGRFQGNRQKDGSSQCHPADNR
jgi:hypothetical protein